MNMGRVTERIGGTVMVNGHGRFGVGDIVQLQGGDSIFRILSFLTTRADDWAVLVPHVLDADAEYPFAVAASVLRHAEAERRFDVGKYYTGKKSARKDSAYRVVHITDKGTVFMVSSVSEDLNYEIVDVTTTQSRDSYVEVRREGESWLPVSS